jgi:hypothetical protein
MIVMWTKSMWSDWLLWLWCDQTVCYDCDVINKNVNLYFIRLTVRIVTWSIRMLTCTWSDWLLRLWCDQTDCYDRDVINKNVNLYLIRLTDQNIISTVWLIKILFQQSDWSRLFFNRLTDQISIWLTIRIISCDLVLPVFLIINGLLTCTWSMWLLRLWCDQTNC